MNNQNCEKKIGVTDLSGWLRFWILISGVSAIITIISFIVGYIVGFVMEF